MCAPARPWPGRPWVGPDPSSWTTSLDRPAFEAGVDTIRAAIGEGRVYQVNLTRRLSAPLPADAEIPALGAALASGNPAPYSAVVHLPEHGIAVASASPERFLTRRGRHVWSSPIKGTAASPDGFLPKDRAENVMIVDLVRNDLGRVCEFGSVNVPSLLAVEPHPGLYHLVTTVEGELRAGIGWPELLDATFPPGSVTGAPKLAALDYIRRLEPVRSRASTAAPSDGSTPIAGRASSTWPSARSGPRTASSTSVRVAASPGDRPRPANGRRPS